MAISMLRRSTVVSITYTNEITHAAIGELVESRAQSKKSFPVRAPSRSLTNVEPMSTPPSSLAHPAVSRCATGEKVHRHVCSSPNCCATIECEDSSNTVQLAVTGTSTKSSSTIKRIKSSEIIAKNIITYGMNIGEWSSTRIKRNQSRKTAAARTDVASCTEKTESSDTVTAAMSATSETIRPVASTRFMLSAQ